MPHLLVSLGVHKLLKHLSKCKGNISASTHMANPESSTQQCNLKGNHVREAGKGLTLLQQREEWTGAYMVKVTFLWGMMMCSLVGKYKDYTGTCFLHLQGRSKSLKSMAVVCQCLTTKITTLTAAILRLSHHVVCMSAGTCCLQDSHLNTNCYENVEGMD